MPQFFLPPASRRGRNFVLAGPEAFHIARVMRCREGDVLDFFDGQGGRCRGRIIRITRRGEVEGIVMEAADTPTPAPRVRLNLYQALLKASRWEWALEKATEIGVSCLIPVVTARTVVRLREVDRSKSKGDRWRRIIMATAKQCGRADLPELKDSLPLRVALERKAGGVSFLAWEKLVGVSARGALRSMLPVSETDENGSASAAGAQRTRELAHNTAGAVDVDLFIGPEGGFTDEEVELARLRGVHLLGLGPRILRAETASMAAASVILYELGAL